MLLVAQVNITSRDAATNPGAIDSLSEFAGTYTTVFKSNDDQAPRPIELAIAASKSGALSSPHTSILCASYHILISLNTVCILACRMMSMFELWCLHNAMAEGRASIGVPC